MSSKIVTALSHAYAMDVRLEIDEEGVVQHVYHADTNCELIIVAQDFKKQKLSIFNPSTGTTFSVTLKNRSFNVFSFLKRRKQ